MADPADHTSELGSMAPLLEALAATPAELLVRGTVVDDQYRIERVLGHGAMGIVYLARDLRLEREVALKVAREASPRALARSAHEAIALARLAHPNVVVVFGVGEVADRLYVVMEYVEGTTARGWCAAATRTVADVLALYGAAGEGLAAAHAVGLVHRDFKPDNVLVGRDGRARVADFGLARASAVVVPGEPPTGESTATDVAGTRAYMAPEQSAGERVGPAADQFAFCVSLWEALHGVRPPDTARAVPRHLELALRRGLATEPGARWPSIAELLVELRRDPTRGRRRAKAAMAIVLVAATAAAGAVVIARGVRSDEPPTPDRCAGGAARIATRWSPTRAAALPAGVASAASQLDDWSTRWAAQYRAVCEADAWTPALRDRGMDCLSRGEHAVDATVEALAEPGTTAAGVAVIVAQLPQPEACADPAYLTAIVAPPTDPALARRVLEVQGQLLRVRMLSVTARHDRADALFAPLLANPVEFPPLIADVHYTAAFLALERGAQDDAVVAKLEAAYFESRATGERLSAIAAAGDLALVQLDRSQDASAAEWARLAEVEVLGVPEPTLQVQTLVTLATVATDRNDAERGLALANRAVDIGRVTGKRGRLELAAALRARAAADDLVGKQELALADLKEAGDILRGIDGERDPTLSSIDAQMSLVLIHLGRIDDAVAAARSSLAIAEAIGPANGELVGNAVGALGVALGHANQLPEALTMLDRSLAIDRAQSGERSYNVASDLNNRADLLTQMHRYDDAVADGKLAIAIWHEGIGDDANEVGAASYNVANALLSAGKYADARAAADRAVAILGKQPENPSNGVALIVRAVAAGHLGAFGDARRDLDAAIALLSHAGNPADLAWAKRELAELPR